MAEAARVSSATVRAAPLNSAVTDPRTKTRVRRHTPAISSKSVETSRTASPSASAWSSRRWIAALAPMSTLAVGSSRISRRRPALSHRPIMTFCWFPPDRTAMGASVSRGRTANRSISVAASERSRRGLIQRGAGRPPTRRLARRFSRTVSSARQPSRSLSPGTRPTPRPTASATVRGRYGRPPRRARPPRRGPIPATARPSSRCPAPDRPTRPRASPALSSRLTGPVPGALTSERASTAAPATGAAAGRWPVSASPTMSCTRRAGLWPASEPWLTRRPSRSTAKVSATSYTSSRRWLT